MMGKPSFLLILCGLALGVELAQAGDCATPSLKETVRAMRAEGLSRSERRLRLLPPLDTAGIAARVRRVGAGSMTQLRLPELRPDVLWTRTSVSDLEASALARVSDPALRQRIQSNSAQLRERLTRLLADRRGILHPEWVLLSDCYVAFSQQVRIIAEDPTHVKTVFLDTMESRLSGQRPPSVTRSANGYVAIPTVRRTDIPVLNEMMSRGTSPLMLTDRGVSLDGFDDMPPNEVHAHDRGHMSNYGPRRTERAGLTPEQYFDEYRRQLSEQIHDDRLRRTVEAGWFLIYHEKEEAAAPYGPRAIRQELADEAAAIETYQGRLGPHDVGDYFPNGVPDEEMIRQAHRWLRGFVRRIEARYPPAQ